MDIVSDMQAFVSIVDTGSFSAAARELDIPKSTLSRRMQRLEDRLGVQLMVRTTRKLTLTDTGVAYYERCRLIAQEIQETEELIRSVHTAPRGKLRVTAPPTGGSGAFSDMMVAFLQKYPEVELEVFLTERYVDLIGEGFDVALRAGTLESSSLRVRRLRVIPIVGVASPAYLERAGTPQTPEALAEHDCLVRPGEGARWRLVDGAVVEVRPRLSVNDMSTIYAAALAGVGIARLPLPRVQADLDAGRLVAVLSEQLTVEHGLHAVYPPNRHLSTRVRAFLDFVAAYFHERELLFSV